jgi:hypothetical protein
MTDNPYAAPLAMSQLEPHSPAATGILAVSWGFRLAGLLGIVLFGLLTSTISLKLGWLMYLVFSAGIVVPDRLFTTGILYLLPSCFLLLLSWLTVRVGRKLPNGQKSTLVTTIVLTCLMLFSCVLTPLGIYSLVKLHEHWRVYCEEQRQRSLSA